MLGPGSWGSNDDLSDLTTYLRIILNKKSIFTFIKSKT